jgi:hypothetical protein
MKVQTLGHTPTFFDNFFDNLLKIRFHAGDTSAFVLSVTPALARKLRVECAFERQRPLRSKNTARLLYELQDGRFVRGTPIQCGFYPDGRVVLLNGNHTLEALGALVEPALMPLTFVLHHVRDDDDAGHIYAVLDTQNRRSWGDSLRAEGMESTQLIGRALAAINCIERGFEHRIPRTVIDSRRERIDLLRTEYPKAIEAFRAAVAGGTTEAVRIITIAPVMAVALYTCKHQETHAYEFWSSMAKDELLKKGDPERAFLTWARNNRRSLSSGRDQRAETAKAAALAWNASFRQENLDMTKPRQLQGLFILGTPLHKGFQKED